MWHESRSIIELANDIVVVNVAVDGLNTQLRLNFAQARGRLTNIRLSVNAQV